MWDTAPPHIFQPVSQIAVLRVGGGGEDLVQMGKGRGRVFFLVGIFDGIELGGQGEGRGSHVRGYA